MPSQSTNSSFKITLGYLVKLQVKMKILRSHFSFVLKKVDKEGYRSKGLCRAKSQRKKLKPQFTAAATQMFEMLGINANRNLAMLIFLLELNTNFC